MRILTIPILILAMIVMAPGSNPAVNEGASLEAGGVFSQTGSGSNRGNTCVVTTSSGMVTIFTRAAGNSGRSWSVQEETTTIDVNTAGPGAASPGGSVISSETNTEMFPAPIQAAMYRMIGKPTRTASLDSS